MKFLYVIKTIRAFAQFAAKGKEVELIAVGILTVRAYRVKVFVHRRKALQL